MTTKRKTVITLMLAVLLIGIATMGAYAQTEEKNIKVWIHDSFIMSDVHPYIDNDRTFVPIRFISEELGYVVSWNEELQTVTVHGEDRDILLTVNSDVAEVGGVEKKLDAPVKIRQDRTFVPLRFIAEAMGENVYYDEEYRVAIVGEGFNPAKDYGIRYYRGNEKTIYLAPGTYNLSTCTFTRKDGTEKKYETGDRFFISLVGEMEKLIEEGFYRDSNLTDRKKESPETAEQPKKDLKPVDKALENSQVPEDKKLVDKYYKAPAKDDPFVGTWYSKTTAEGIDGNVDTYAYIEKTGDDEYKVTERIRLSDGSDLMTESTAKIGNEKKELKLEGSHKIVEATGQFDENWNTPPATFKLKAHNQMYLVNQEGKQYTDEYYFRY